MSHTAEVIQIIKKQIDSLLEHKENIIIAIDGRCGSGKTSLAAKLKEVIDCNVIPMDDFFLRPEQRTQERYAQAGGNVDYERFLKEVMEPVVKGEDFSYRPFDCRIFQLSEPLYIKKKSVTIIEGSYSCHPVLWEYYDYRIFLTIDYKEQLHRILLRNGEEKQQIFIDKWIPYEEKYFENCRIEEKCDCVFSLQD